MVNMVSNTILRGISWGPHWALALGVCLMAGCDESDGEQHRRVAEVAQRGTDRKAEQKREMARLNREVAEGTRRMVEADALARADHVAVHHEIQAERAVLHEGFDALEDERQQIAQQRRTESALGPALGLVSGTLVVSAVIGLCMLLLKESQRSDPSDADVNAILIGELVSEYPRLLPGPSVPPALSSRPPNSEPDTPRLTSAENITDDSPE